MAEYISGRYLKDNAIESREYQNELVESGLKENTLVTLPTGTGKTPVGARIMLKRLETAYSENSSVKWRGVITATTQPLVKQHVNFFQEVSNIPDEEIVFYTGDTRPQNRPELWEKATIVAATPKVLENDLLEDRITFNSVVHLIFDECHHTTEKHSYSYLADKYEEQAAKKLITGLTASPGSDENEVKKVCSLLGISDIEVRHPDEISEEYLPPTMDTHRKISLPDELQNAYDAIESRFKDRMVELKELGVSDTSSKSISYKRLLGMRKNGVNELIQKDESKGYYASKVLSEAQKLYRLRGHIGTQPVEFSLEKMEEEIESAESASSNKSTEELVASEEFQTALECLRSFDNKHPKMLEILNHTIDTVSDEGQVIIFAENRRVTEIIADYLDQYIDAQPFVGQTKKDDGLAMTRDDQLETIEKYRNGEYDVLVSTSVGEEGLDLPAVDLVIAFEPAGTAIKSVQRLGRTGRETAGKALYLMTKGTGDVDRYYKARSERKKMRKNLKQLKSIEGDISEEFEDEREEDEKFDSEETTLDDFTTDDTSETLDSESEDSEQASEIDVEDVDGDVLDFDSEKPKVIADKRELRSSVVNNLDTDSDIEMEAIQLEVADYVLSPRVAVERKTPSDFVSTLAGDDRDLFDQAGALVGNYERGILLIEGTKSELFTAGNMPPNAIRGALDSLVVDFGISILHTEDEEETAKHLSNIAKREQEDSSSTVQHHAGKSSLSRDEQKEYIVSSIPDIGTKTAQTLLEEFKTIENIVTANEEQLKEVDGVGDVIAEQLRELVSEEYNS